MKPSLRLICPECERKFPFLLGASSRVFKGAFAAPWFECQHCGMISRRSTNWPHAIWAWPLAILAVASVIAVFQNAKDLVLLHHHHPGVYGALGGMCMGLCLSIGRFGMKLTPLSGGSGRGTGPGRK